MPKPKLQLALDTTSIETAMQIAEELREYWDILEIGTALLMQEGLDSAAIFREKFPHATIFVDTKIIDSGKLLAESACRAGADIISVVSAASNRTVSDCAAAAHAMGSRVLLDHLSVDWVDADLIRKADLGIDIVGLHIPKDRQGSKEFHGDVINAIKDLVDSEICIAGGITPQAIRKLKGVSIDIFVVGIYLLQAKGRVENAKQLTHAMKQLSQGEK